MVVPNQINHYSYVNMELLKMNTNTKHDEHVICMVEDGYVSVYLPLQMTIPAFDLLIVIPSAFK